MRKTAPLGTKVVSQDQMEGFIIQTRKTMPEMDSRFDYGVEVDPDGTGTRMWCYAASELTEVKP